MPPVAACDQWSSKGPCILPFQLLDWLIPRDVFLSLDIYFLIFVTYQIVWRKMLKLCRATCQTVRENKSAISLALALVVCSCSPDLAHWHDEQTFLTNKTSIQSTSTNMWEAYSTSTTLILTFGSKMFHCCMIIVILSSSRFGINREQRCQCNSLSRNVANTAKNYNLRIVKHSTERFT